VINNFDNCHDLSDLDLHDFISTYFGTLEPENSLTSVVGAENYR